MAFFYSSSVGNKIIMSMAGSFLMVFLVVHLGINLLLLVDDGGELYNKAAHFMTSNWVVKSMQVALFSSVLLHAVYGVFLQIQNGRARPVGYRVNKALQESYFSKYMIHTAVVIGVFIGIHLLHFYFKAGSLPTVAYDGVLYDNWSGLVLSTFKITPVFVIYLVSYLCLGFHLHHAFQSAFQTIGLNGGRTYRLLRISTAAYAILITAGYGLISILLYLK